MLVLCAGFNGRYSLHGLKSDFGVISTGATPFIRPTSYLLWAFSVGGTPVRQIGILWSLQHWTSVTLAGPIFACHPLSLNLSSSFQHINAFHFPSDGENLPLSYSFFVTFLYPLFLFPHSFFSVFIFFVLKLPYSGKPHSWSHTVNWSLASFPYIPIINSTLGGTVAKPSVWPSAFLGVLFRLPIAAVQLISLASISQSLPGDPAHCTCLVFPNPK